ncbi:MAG: RnfABCDGE type electron transport complex subunit G [Oscillibacter sp.]|nr:RnfABCDGE type electron transport complex subunit G [Oscillibacter sp.]
MDPRYVGRIAGVLLSICLVVALLLGAVNQVTKPRIDAIQKARTEAAMRQVLTADSYEKLGFTAANVTAVYQAVSGGEAIGWVVETSASGSQGIINMMVGVDTEGRVTGVSVVSHSETPNIGTKVVADQSVLDRFIGMSHAGGEITVNSGSNRFDGVSGATVSSRGVAAGVNAALAAIGVK